MWWAALLPPASSAHWSRREAIHLSTWALGFTPRVSLHPAPALVMEVSASLRLFGGWARLRERVAQESQAFAVQSMAWAPNPEAAVCLARCGIAQASSEELEAALDALPIQCLDATKPHLPTLLQLGIRTLGELRRLPRGGISRRFDTGLLLALDLAYGLVSGAHRWVTLPDTFQLKLELPSQVDTAPALLFVARRLLLSLAGWLAARHAGVTAIRLRWLHDTLRAKDVEPDGQVDIRSAVPTRDIDHLHRLLAEHLAQIRLAAPVGDLELQALDVQALGHESLSLLSSQGTAGPSQGFLTPAGGGLGAARPWGRSDIHSAATFGQVMERISARLGPSRVRQGMLRDDTRVGWLQHWSPRADGPSGRWGAMPAPPRLPQPTWLLDEPLPLAERGHRPIYQGELLLLVGPHRIDGGWWHLEGGQTHRHARDYWVALSQTAGTLWVFKDRSTPDAGWFLHGIFA